VDLCYAHQLTQTAARAEQTCQRAHERALAAYPGHDTHPNVLKARVAYAQALAANGQMERAIKDMQLAIHDATMLFGTSRIVGIDLLRLSRLHLQAGQIELALENANAASSILVLPLDPKGAGYAAMLEMRGNALLAARRPREALADLALASNLLNLSFGPGHAASQRLQSLRKRAVEEIR
jgi:tetratricopeptide (TPR) repeat protein